MSMFTEPRICAKRARPMRMRKVLVKLLRAFCFGIIGGNAPGVSGSSASPLDFRLKLRHPIVPRMAGSFGNESALDQSSKGGLRCRAWRLLRPAATKLIDWLVPTQNAPLMVVSNRATACINSSIPPTRHPRKKRYYLRRFGFNAVLAWLIRSSAFGVSGRPSAPLRQAH